MRSFFAWPSWTNTRLFGCKPLNERSDFDKCASAARAGARTLARPLAGTRARACRWMACFHFALSTMTTMGYGCCAATRRAALQRAALRCNML